MQQHESRARNRRMGRIPDATAYSGLSRSSLYLKASEHRGLFRKDADSVLVDFDILDRILDALPTAKISNYKQRPRRVRRL